MTKSHYNTFACWLLLTFCIFFISLLLIGISQSSKFNIEFAVAGLCVFSVIGSFKIKIITIDSKHELIKVRNFLTRHTNLYSFSDLDGFCDMIFNHGRSGVSYKSIGLIKDKNVILKIDGYYYSNIEEIRSSLAKLKYLGINIDWTKQKF